MNAELERENQTLLVKLDEKGIQIDSLMKHLNDLERNSLPLLRKSLRDISIEKNTATVAREDALSQLLSIKKRLKDAEEDQYRAEQDSAVLRAELNLLQQQGLGSTHSGIQFGNSPDHILSLEKEIMVLKTELLQEFLLRQQEQRKLSEEQLRSSSLLTEKKELEEKLASLNKKISEDASDLAACKISSLNNSGQRMHKTLDVATLGGCETNRLNMLIGVPVLVLISTAIVYFVKKTKPAGKEVVFTSSTSPTFASKSIQHL